MSAPYRDADHLCLACQQPLRGEGERLVCDACSAALIPVDTLLATIRDLTKLPPLITFTNERAAPDRCPRCAGAMMRCRINVQLEETSAHPWRSLLRCASDGVWFAPKRYSGFLALVERKASDEYKRELGPRAHGLFGMR